MQSLRSASVVGAVVACLASIGGCGDAGEDEGVTLEAMKRQSRAMPPGQCQRAEPTDVLIAELVKDSWRTNYPLTRLRVDPEVGVTGPGLPDALAGQLEVINSIPEARAALERAVAPISGLPDYGMAGIGPDTEACHEVAAWTPDGTTVIATTANQVFPNGVNEDSWREVHKHFGKESPLVKRVANRDIIDPPGDGSTNLAPSATVSAYGVTANAWGLCPYGTRAGTYCKLSYADGVNYTGRKCLYYYGSLRCLLY